MTTHGPCSAPGDWPRVIPVARRWSGPWCEPDRRASAGPRTWLPIRSGCRKARSAWLPLVDDPSSASSTSPDRKPARSAGPPRVMLTTWRAVRCPARCARPSGTVIGCSDTPSQPRRLSPPPDCAVPIARHRLDRRLDRDLRDRLDRRQRHGLRHRRRRTVRRDGIGASRPPRSGRSRRAARRRRRRTAKTLVMPSSRPVGVEHHRRHG